MIDNTVFFCVVFVIFAPYIISLWLFPSKQNKPARNNSKAPHNPTAAPKPKAPRKPTISPETLIAMHIQAEKEQAIAEALERKAKYIPDPVKRARIEKQAANSWVRFNSILDKLEKLESSV